MDAVEWQHHQMALIEIGLVTIARLIIPLPIDWLCALIVFGHHRFRDAGFHRTRMVQRTRMRQVPCYPNQWPEKGRKDDRKGIAFEENRDKNRLA
ncbi:MAG: hypothetical protein KDI68_12300 [Gammaproteobacteria bacterium]|nr:hypothetical protein [Gammaproteobacteria bacterium]